MALIFMKKPATIAQPVASTPQSLLSIKDAADYCRVSQQTMRRLIKAGRLKSYRIGRQIRIDMVDLANYLSF